MNDKAIEAALIVAERHGASISHETMLYIIEAYERAMWPLDVSSVQPYDDCPGLWIGFNTAEDRERIIALLRPLPPPQKDET